MGVGKCIGQLDDCQKGQWGVLGLAADTTKRRPEGKTFKIRSVEISKVRKEIEHHREKLIGEF
jgi:hypothetical protein